MAFHDLLVRYVHDKNAALLLRMIRGTERRHLYTTRDGIRFKATDNAPAWWIHTALLQNYKIDPAAFAEVITTVLAHMFAVAATCAPTANQAGWHVAHIFDVKDGRTDFQHWGREDVDE